MALVTLPGQVLFYRDSASGFERDELMGLKIHNIILGDEASPALSTEHSVGECVPSNTCLDGSVKEQKPHGVMDAGLGFLEDG